MRKLLAIAAIWLTFFGAMQPVYASPPKSHYGHYFALSDNVPGQDTPTDAITLCNVPGMQGVEVETTWIAVEGAAQGTFDFSFFDSFVNKIHAQAPSCHYWLRVDTKSFASSAVKQPCPTWLKDSGGYPGYAPSGNSTGNVIAITNATNSGSTITLTTAINHGLTTGAQIFVDNVAGDLAANGAKTATVVSANQISVPASGTTAAYVSGGRVFTGTNVYTCKIYDSTVQKRYNDVLKALGTKYDSDPQFEGLVFQETALGFGAPYDQDATTTPAHGTYTAAGFRDALILQVQNCAAAVPGSRCMQFMNFLLGGQTPTKHMLTDVSNAISAIPNNQVCMSGPDLLPNNGSFWTNTDSVYEVLSRHVGCRANSAQNDSFNVAGCDLACIANFAERGNFGDFIPGPTAGVCVNSYIFWNHITFLQATGQDWRDVQAVATANPYGEAWYGQCVCGGGAP